MPNNENSVERAIPLTILTGFLGSGKTTMLNRILNGNHGLRVAVLVNDFGSINIDADLIVGVDNDVISLANGCICCSVREDMINAVIDISKRPEQPEYVLLEASGVANPMPLATTFSMQELRDRVRLDSITCIIDAEQVFEHPEQMELKIQQVAFSDMVVVNKIDLVDSERLEAIREWIGKRLYRYRIIETQHCNVPLEILLAVGRFDPSTGNDNWIESGNHVCEGIKCNHPNHHDHRVHEAHPVKFSTWSYETDHPLLLEDLEDVASRMPTNVYRVKGIVRSLEFPEKYAVLQVVGKRVDLSLEGEWGTKNPYTRIVAIGAPGALEPEQLQKKIDSCKS